MEIILKQYVKGLGDKNDLVTVKDGYGRNYLIPQKLAVLATESAKRQRQEALRQASHRLEHIKNEAQAVADRLGELELIIETLAGVDGKLFGSVTTLMVENRLKEKGFDVDRRRISFDDDIKETGEYTATIDIHKEVKAELKIVVIAKEN